MVIKEAEEDLSDEGIEIAMENHAAEHTFQSRSDSPPTRAEVRCRFFFALLRHSSGPAFGFHHVSSLERQTRCRVVPKWEMG